MLNKILTILFELIQDALPYILATLAVIFSALLYWKAAIWFFA